MKSKKIKPDSPEGTIVELFLRSGYTRAPDEKRIKEDGRRKYKKGYEVRFSLINKKELSQLRKALRSLKIPYGSPFMKHKRIILPVYGRDSYEKIISLVEGK